MFNTEKIQITSIFHVWRHYSKSEKTISKWDGNLKTYELIYKISGNPSIVTFNNKKFEPIIADTILYLPRGIKGANYISEKTSQSETTPGECINIFFHTDGPMPQEALLIDAKSNPNLKSLFNKIAKQWNQHLINNTYYYRCMGLLYQIIGEISAIEDFKNIKYSVLNPAVTYINDHFSEKDLDATLLHKMCDLSYTHFKRLFINQFGVSPKKYIITQRMNLAHNFLSSGQYSISEVAELCGYDNPYYFSNAFKSHFGYSPSQCK